jgi:hypothetical protein
MKWLRSNWIAIVVTVTLGLAALHFFSLGFETHVAAPSPHKPN